VTAVDPGKLAAWRSFLQAHAVVTEALGRELEAERDLPLSFYEVLLHLHEAPHGRLRMAELAERILLSKSGLTRLVDRMEEAGLVERAECPTDRRGIEAAITPVGRQTLREAAPVHLRGIEEHFASRLSAQEAETIERSLRKIVAGLRGESARPKE
jgi:DNA-binding MarR family transcriptional regulator